MNDPEKMKSLQDLETPEGRLSFIGYFEEQLLSIRGFIGRGGGFLAKERLEEWVEDMQKSAENLRKKYPMAAKTIDEAREKIISILESLKKDK